MVQLRTFTSLAFLMPDKFGLIRSREFVGLRRAAKATRVVACPSKPHPDRVKAKGGIFLFLFPFVFNWLWARYPTLKLLGQGGSSRAPSLFRGVERSVKLTIQSTRIHSDGSGVWPCRSCVFGPRVLPDTLLGAPPQMNQLAITRTSRIFGASDRGSRRLAIHLSVVRQLTCSFHPRLVVGVLSAGKLVVESSCSQHLGAG